MAGVGREAHGDFLEVGFRIQQGGGGEVVRGPVQQPDRFGKLHPLDVALAVGGVFRSQNHGDEGVPLHLHGGGEAVARLAGAAGFDADGTAVGVPRMEGGGEQGVGVIQRPLPGEVGGGDGIGPGGDDLPEGGVGHGLLGHFEDVPGGGIVVIAVQAVGVDEVGAAHPQFLGPLVHLLHEGGDVPGHRDGQGIGCFVGRSQQQAVEEVAHGDLLPRLQAGGGGVRGEVGQGGIVHGDDVVQVQLPPAHGL